MRLFSTTVPTAGSLTVGAGYTQIQFSNDTSAGDAAISGGKSITATGVQTATCGGNSTDVMSQLITTFKASSGGSSPSISSLTPNSGAVTSAIVIGGSNFGTAQGTVTFNGTSATISNWNTGSITALVPTGATTGNVVVTAGGVASNGVSFTVTPAPNISSLTPTSGAVNASVVIAGTNFGSSQGNGSVTFNGTPATQVGPWGTNSITATVPSGATTGNVVVTAAGGVASNGVSFTVLPTPNITGLTPNSGAVNSSIVIAGSNFGSAVGTVKFNGTAATTISNWTAGSITALVPTGATTGNVVVTTSGGVSSNGVSFTVTGAPSITSLTPTSGGVGVSVVIAGAKFGATQGNGSVTFNGTPATQIAPWGNGSITAVVPSGATTGNVVVTAAGGVASNGISFTVTNPPPYSFSVTYAPDGAILTANDSVNGNWTYTYDDFARLITANNSAPTQGFSYVYDQYGNRWQQNLTAGSGGTSNLTFSNNSSAATYGTTGQCYHAAGVTNQPDGYCYDAAGNLLNDGQHSYTYDAENRIISVDGGSTATYTYNGGGQRVRKVSSAGTADYLYDLGGHQITELNASGGWFRGEVYAGGRHVATYRNSTTYFLQSDWQGTERVLTSLNGAECETTTNLPFGDGQATNGSCGDLSPMHFTGQVRDTETNLDYFGARFYASALGRFVTPDWDGKPAAVPYAEFGDPQSLNLYAYVRNSPIARVDLTGHNYAGWDGAYADKTGGLTPFDDAIGSIIGQDASRAPGYDILYVGPTQEQIASYQAANASAAAANSFDQSGIDNAKQSLLQVGSANLSGTCQAFLDQIGAAAPRSFTAASLQQQATASAGFVYDGASSPTPMSSIGLNGKGTVGDEFTKPGLDTFNALSQPNGNAIWVRSALWGSKEDGPVGQTYMDANGRPTNWAKAEAMHETMHKFGLYHPSLENMMGDVTSRFSRAMGSLGVSVAIQLKCFPN